MSVEIIGLNSTLEELLLNIDGFKLEVNILIQEAGMECEGQAIQYCPVDTHNLVNSIKYTPGDMECTVSTDVDYSVYQELGTSKMRAQPFMLPAFEIAKNHLLQGLGQ